MELDDDLCICFHVSQRKVLNYLRVEQPERAGQLADCFGAGTGCGWCRPYLKRMFEAARQNRGPGAALPPSQEYGRLRARFLDRRNESADGEPGR